MAKIGTNTSKPDKNFEKAKNFGASLKKLMSYMSGQKSGVIFAVILSLLASIFSIIGPYFLGKITDELYLSLQLDRPLNLDLITNIGITLIIFYSLSLVTSYFQGFIMSNISNYIGRKMRDEISLKINKMPLKYFDNNAIGDTMSRITNDITTLTSTLSQSFASGIMSIISVLSIIVIMFIISWQLALIVLVFVPITFLVIFVIMKFSQKHFVKLQKELGELNAKSEESYSALNLINAFNAETEMINNFETINSKLYNSTQKSTFFSGIIHPVSNFFANLTYMIVCLFGAGLIFSGNILIGAIASFVIYIRQFNQPLSEIASIMGTLQSTVAAAERVFEILDEKEEADEKDKLAQFKDIPVLGRVEFKEVCFGYEKDKEIIHNFNFVANPGEKIAIVGPTGAGKTTLINLMMRFYELDSGEILIDNKNINLMKRKEVRKQFSMVLQDTWLFEGTIKDNVAYGNSKITVQQIENACQLANIDHFIKTLPEGYNTVINESLSLSQGQRQLLTIARGMIKDAPMLILDEATSSVDTRTEILIQEAMDRLSSNKTSFVIAHRLSTIQNADKIIVMKEGKIVEVGKHEQLLEQNGFYAELYKSQFSN